MVALLAGVVLFNLLTRRLRLLTGAVESFRESDFSNAGMVRTGLGNTRGDEIGRLAATFERMAERINQQVRKLRQTDELRRELVANVSHDLRTPLASLRGYLETLELKEERIDDAISAILILNTVANTLGATMAGAQAAHVFGSAAVGIFSGILTFLILVFSEIIPKTLGALPYLAMMTCSSFMDSLSPTISE